MAANLVRYGCPTASASIESCHAELDSASIGYCHAELVSTSIGYRHAELDSASIEHCHAERGCLQPISASLVQRRFRVEPGMTVAAGPE